MRLKRSKLDARLTLRSKDAMLAIEDCANLFKEDLEGEAAESGNVLGDKANLGEGNVVVLGEGVVVLSEDDVAVLSDEGVADLGNGDDIAVEDDVTLVLAVEVDTDLAAVLAGEVKVAGDVALACDIAVVGDVAVACDVAAVSAWWTPRSAL